MNVNELKNFIYNACLYLGIELSYKGNNDLQLVIPDELLNEFNNEKEFEITFDKDRAEENRIYVTNEAFIVQKLALLVANKNNGVTVGKVVFPDTLNQERIAKLFPDCKIENFQKNNLDGIFLVATIKITMRLNKIEEFLHSFRCNLQTGECYEIPVPSEIYAGNISQTEPFGYKRDDFLFCWDRIMPFVTDCTEKRFQEKQEEYNNLCQIEIDRINEYYNLVLSEQKNSEKNTNNDTTAVLESERESLINEQYKKFAIAKTSVTVEPISFCLINEKSSPVSFTASNRFGTVSPIFYSFEEIRCQYSNTISATFTITSENKICSTEKTFICSNCGKRLYENKKRFCSVCNAQLCDDCSSISKENKQVFCPRHASIAT